MVVRRDGRGRGQYAQGARHAEMQQRAAGLRVHQQVLRAPLDAFDALAAQAGHEFGRNRPAQLRLAHHQLDHAPADQMRREATARGFDFGQLGHRRRLFAGRSGKD